MATAEQKLLLRAALCEGSAAVDAWRDWRSRTNVDDLDSDSQWLLPQLSVNLEAVGVPATNTARYRSVYRHNWYKNQVMLRRAEAVIDRLAREGRRPVILGGAAMALRRPEVIGARPFDGVDVRTPDDPPARPAGPDPALLLHTHAVTWRHRRWPVLAAAAQLVDICVRRTGWDGRSNLLWIADVVTLVRHDRPDWTAVAPLASRLGREGEVGSALAHVERILGLPIPTTLSDGSGGPPEAVAS